MSTIARLARESEFDAALIVIGADCELDELEFQSLNRATVASSDGNSIVADDGNLIIAEEVGDE